jgi:hypothetical protein
VDCPGCPDCDECAGVTCDDPPAPAVCYEPTGTCTAGGRCDYAYDDGENCDDGDDCTTDDECALGRCDGTPVECDDPPDPVCVTSTSVRTGAATGTCSGGDCAYGATVEACDDPPADVCVDAITVRSWSNDGSCSGDQCSYTFTDRVCSSVSHCEDGRCCRSPGQSRTVGFSCGSSGGGGGFCN